MSIDTAALRPKLEAALGGQLQLGELLGEGGFAAVFRASDPFLERDVAIKVLDPSLDVDAALEVFASVVTIMTPQLAGAVTPFALALGVGEVPMGIWLLIWGARNQADFART